MNAGLKSILINRLIEINLFWSNMQFSGASNGPDQAAEKFRILNDWELKKRTIRSREGLLKKPELETMKLRWIHLKTHFLQMKTHHLLLHAVNFYILFFKIFFSSHSGVLHS